MALLNLTSLLNLRPAKIAPQNKEFVSTQLEQEKTAQKSYWTERIGSKLPLVEWPGYTRKANAQPNTKQQYKFDINSALRNKANLYANNHGLDLFSVLFATYRILLFRYTQQEDVVICMQHADLTYGAGNIFPVRHQTETSKSFVQILNEIQQITTEAYFKTNISYESLLAPNYPANDIFQVFFRWQSLSTGFIHADIINPVQMGLDLTLEISDRSDILSCNFEYNTHIFDSAAMSRMAGHLQMLLEAVLEHDRQTIDGLPMLTHDEREQLLVDFNQPVLNYTSNCAHHLFEQQAQKSPNAVAIINGQKHITYEELNNKANQLAHYLKRLKVDSETVVGLCMKRSPEFIVGLLGILKAGGAFMPIDPDLPTDRLTFMLEDARPALILTQDGLLDVNVLNRQLPLLYIDLDWPLISLESTININQDVLSSNLMYVIYTSGSSGKPKGVLVEHASLTSFLKASEQIIDIHTQDRVLQFVPIVFDPMIEDVFCTFYRGAALVLRTEDMIDSAQMFLAKCEELEITILNLPAAYWHTLTGELANQQNLHLPSCIRLIKVGGERLLPEKVHTWKKLFGGFPRLLNAYGPTETTIAATIYDCADFEYQSLEVPIGYRMANTKAYVLDTTQQPVPIGLVGELYIGGQAVARGYLNRNELTTQKFVSDPFSKKSQARMYRTGDMVRWLPDGKLEYKGRMDDQVKIRGFRIELGEIESVLSQHPFVKQVVVIAHEREAGEKQLIAYVVTPFQELEIAVLRNYLKEKMPQYMIPSLFVLLDKLPLTFNGKINRKALPNPSIQLSNKLQAPQTHQEKLLVDLWLKVLSIKEVSILDNFFEIGGHSLLAARLTAEIKNTLQCELPLSWVFANPTIKEQTQYLALPPVQNICDTLIEIQAGENKAPLYLIHDGSGGVEYGFQVSQFMAKDQPIYGFQAIGLNGLDDPLQSVEAMANNYVERLLSHQPEGPYHIGAYSGGATIAYEMIYQLAALGKQIGLVVIFDAYPVNLNRFTYQRVGLTYVMRSVVNLLISPDIRFKHKIKLIFNEIPEIVQNNWMRIVLRLTEQKVDKVTDPATKFHLTLRSAVDNYRIKPYAGSILFIRAIENQARYLRNSHFGWGRYARHVKIYDLPGDHKAIFRDKQNAKAIADIIQRHLTEHNNKYNTHSLLPSSADFLILQD